MKSQKEKNLWKEAVEVLSLSPFYFRIPPEERKVLIAEWLGLHEEALTAEK